MSDDTKEPFFSKEKQDIALKWLEDKWPRKVCDICGNMNWNLFQSMIVPMNFENGRIVDGKVMPQVAVVCANCGNTKFFSAVLVGILNPGSEESAN